MQDVRRSGVLLHLTSLPGKYGIGTLNHEAYHWVNFLTQHTPDACGKCCRWARPDTATAPIRVSARLPATLT